jgi:putative protease
VEVREQRSPITNQQEGERREVALTFGNGEVDFRRLRPGDRLWKTSDPALERRLRQTYEGDQVRYPRPLDLEVHGSFGQPLTVIARDEAGHVAQASSAMPLTLATSQPLSATRLAEQLGRLGGTVFRLGRVHSRLSGDVMLPLSELNRLRRELVAELDRQRALP